MHPALVTSLIATWLCSGGLIQGWGPLYTLLLAEEPTSDGESKLQVAYQGGFIALSVFSVVFGLALDRIGPRLTAFLGLLLAVVGNLLMAFTTGLDTVLPALACIAGGGIGPYLANMSFGNLTSRPSVYIAVNGALFNFSGFNYMLLALGLGLTRKSFFLGYAVVAGAAALMVLLTYPKTAPKKVDPLVDLGDAEEDLLEGENDAEADMKALASGVLGGDTRSVRDCIKDPLLIGCLVFYTVQLFIVSYMGGAMVSILASKSDDQNLVNVYNNYLYPILSNGTTTLISPLVGYLIGKRGFTAVFTVCNITSQAFLMFTFLQGSIHLQILSLSLYGCQKAFLITSFFAFLAVEFPLRINGTLTAFCTAAAAAVGLGTIPLASASAKAGTYTVPIIVLAVLTLPLYGYPIMLNMAARRKASQARLAQPLL